MNRCGDRSFIGLGFRVAAVWSLVLGIGLYFLNLFFVPFLAQLPVSVSLLVPAYSSALSVFVQYSKKNVEPVNYVAILGDSYAQGLGDWFYRVQQQTRPEYQVTHLLSREIGRDVVTFGYMGSSSISGYVLLPLEKFMSADLMRGFRLQKPADVVLYFYEGNDLEDNQLEMNRHAQEGGERTALLQHAGFDRYIEQQGAKIRQEIAVTQQDWYAQCLACRFLADAIRYVGLVALHGKDDVPEMTAVPIGSLNAVELESGVVRVPDKLVGPALSLNEEKLAESLVIFDYSLRYAKTLFPGARMVMVYIPAPASLYQFAGDVSTPEGSFSGASIKGRSRMLCERVARLAGLYNIPLLDVAPALQARARQVLVHGPVDWEHFNEEGYRVLSGELSSWLKRPNEAPLTKTKAMGCQRE